jgi:hypothetical protein
LGRTLVDGDADLANVHALQEQRGVGHRGQRLALPPAGEGRFDDDFLQRAAGQSLASITANDPAEAVYLVKFNDAHDAKPSPGAATNCGSAPAIFPRRTTGEGTRALFSAYPRGL